MGKAEQLRALLDEPGIVIAPGAHDCVSALILERAGHPCIYQTGYGTAASFLGYPDSGLIGRAEMVDQARRLAQTVNIPIISDVDDGFGNPLGVKETVKAFELAGSAGIHMEDQKMPKRCGHMGGKQLISTDEMCMKIRAAVDARSNPAFLLIARCDARSVDGLDAAIERGNSYAEAGADMIFIESPYSVEDAQLISKGLQGIPLCWNAATGRTSDGGKTPWVPVEVLEELGFKLVLFSVQMLWAAAQTMTELAKVMHDTKSYQSYLDRIMPFTEFNDLIGLSEIQELEKRYAT
jgi:2-methylisocitrate lyase-like PEP mutase family enzyme